MNGAVRVPGAGRVAVFTSLALLGCCGTARADSSPPKESSAVSQYIENLPGPTGPIFPGTQKRTVRPLPPRVETAVREQGGSDAPLLKEVVRSTKYGAPQKPLPRRAPVDPGGRLPNEPKARKPAKEAATATKAVFANAGRVVTAGTDARLVGLAALMVAIAGVAGIAARSRRHPASF